jgi:hypothetical protein
VNRTKLTQTLCGADYGKISTGNAPNLKLKRGELRSGTVTIVREKETTNEQPNERWLLILLIPKDNMSGHQDYPSRHS